MKKVLIILTLVLIIALPLSAANYAKPNGVGAGLTLGYPTGLTGRYGMDDFRFLGNFTWDYSNGFYFDVGVLYDITEVTIANLPIYINAGVQTGIGIAETKFQFSVNAIIGASYYFEDVPIELFLNLAPGVAIMPSLGFSPKGGLGAIWYFD